MAMLTKGICLRNSNHLRTIVAFVASSLRRDALSVVALETLGPAGEPPVRKEMRQKGPTEARWEVGNLVWSLDRPGSQD